MKLDFNPSCLYAYSVSAAESPDTCGSVKTILSSHTNQLMILQDSSLMWAAGTSHTPVQVTVASFQSVV